MCLGNFGTGISTIKIAAKFEILFLYSACKYFLYDTTTKDCQHLDGTGKDCDVIRGPPEPDMGTLECGEETPDTTITPLANQFFWN